MSHQDEQSNVEILESDSPFSPSNALGSMGMLGALVVAWTAMLGSLYFSEVRGFIPCQLCWYQRILMYPLTLLITVGLLRQEKSLPYFVLPFSIIGSGYAAYHYLLQKTTVFGAPVACQAGVPCTTAWINWFGFVTIPFLALTAFTLITLLCLVAIYREEPWPQRPVLRTTPVAIILGIGLIIYVVMAQFNAPAPQSTTSDFVVETVATGDQMLVTGEEAISPETLAQGQTLYAEACAACHGPEGQGVPNLGSSLVGSEFLTTAPQADVLAMIREGRMPGHPDNYSGMVMPGSGGRPDLSNEEVWAIVQYLRNQGNLE